MPAKRIRYNGALYVQAEEPKNYTQHVVDMVMHDKGIAHDIITEVQEKNLDLVEEVRKEYPSWVITAVKDSIRESRDPHEYKKVTEPFILSAVNEALQTVDWAVVAEAVKTAAQQEREENPQYYE